MSKFEIFLVIDLMFNLLLENDVLVGLNLVFKPCIFHEKTLSS